jgi:hypothetical protein
MGLNFDFSSCQWSRHILGTQKKIAGMPNLAAIDA